MSETNKRLPWRYAIQYGPEGEANYAWVYDGNGARVCTAKTHHAMSIVEAANALSSKDAEIEALRTRAESAEALLAEAGKAVKALGEIVGLDCSYVGPEIRIPSRDHGDAIARVSRARSTLSKIGDRT